VDNGRSNGVDDLNQRTRVVVQESRRRGRGFGNPAGATPGSRFVAVVEMKVHEPPPSLLAVRDGRVAGDAILHVASRNSRPA